MRNRKVAVWGILLAFVGFVPCLVEGQNKTGSGLRPVSEIMNPDGTLRLEKGLAGSLDPRGYRMVAKPGQAPRFVPSSTKPAGRQTEAGLLGADSGYWDGIFGISGVGGPVTALGTNGSTLYACGDFAGPPDRPLNDVAKWDGIHWSAVGSGLPRGEGEDVVIWAIAASGETVYVGGYHSSPSEGTTRGYVAKWDGSSWSTLAAGFTEDFSTVAALALIGDVLYVGGYFTKIGEVTVHNIAKWDGSAWSALGSGTNYSVEALIAGGTFLYAGGNFTTAGGNTARRIAKWDLIAGGWSALEANGMNSTVTALAVGGSLLYAGGTFTTAGGGPANSIAVWNGSTWSALGSGLENYGATAWVRSLEVSSGNIYAGGEISSAGGVAANGVAIWNGSSWSALGSGFSTYLVDLAVVGSTLFAAGPFDSAGGVPAYYVAQWNGSWADVGSAEYGGTNSGVTVVAASGSDLYVAGEFSMAGGTPIDILAKWDGQNWSALGSGIGGDTEDVEIEALAVHGGDLFVGGEFYLIGGVPANGIAKWDGSNWSPLGTGIVGGDYNVFSLALSDDGNSLYVGGDFLIAGSVVANNIAKWDIISGTWSALKTALGTGVDGPVEALAVSGSTVYVGGSFTSAGGVAANCIAKWDGASWSAVGSGLGPDEGQIYALALMGSTLYAGGYFGSIDGVAAAGIAMWNGTNWSALGSGLTGGYLYVEALAVSGSDLYAGGSFTTAGGVVVNNIAKWDGTDWSALGVGIPDGAIYGLTVVDSALYVGGAFFKAGGVSSSNIALWHFNPMSPRKDDLLGTWDGQGVYYRNSDTRAWVKMASPATMITTGDLDGDGIDDLIGLWPTQGGIWVKYSETGAWAKLSSTARYICSGDMNGDGRVDLVGTWDGQGVFYRNSLNGAWVKMASPATMVTSGDIDNDGTDDLIGLWPSQGGIWVKYSQTGAWAKLSSTAVHIAAGDMDGDGRDDLLGTWDGQGVYYRNSVNGAWVKMASPATLITTGDIDGDETDDLIGIWPSQGGVWVKYSNDGTWEKLSSTAEDITAGKMRAAAGGSTASSAEALGVQLLTIELPLPMGGFSEGPDDLQGAKDFSEFGPLGICFLFKEQKNLTPRQNQAARSDGMLRPGPGEPGFWSAEQKNLVPQGFEKRELKKVDKKNRPHFCGKLEIQGPDPEGTRTSGTCPPLFY